ncbi:MULTISPECIES: fimbrial protein [Tenebrionibacter/Tenebrionicola group]|jgi:type 1 fimbria pilin|uniref:Type 1 fimbrial protein n=2 Tax=Tenebrionibacter/Tenebrionicola group TaxID=2969848 RepID=A0A8K0V3Y3_9ENTR|nr:MULTISPECIES: fimbrial protein [Tenebrionibacter/Tenebrionicola group]MBK4714644.1 type 1 fimbrial protein [Tenebrionibacter intestinalis]MBV5095098.1 type 1 fimbrial protein [Tenebrionicola larvae]
MFNNTGFRMFTFLLIILFSACSPAMTGQQTGYINMKGSIVETPCSIATQAMNQTVAIKSLSVSDNIHYAQAPGQRFSIFLIHCALKKLLQDRSTEKYFNVAFDSNTVLTDVKAAAKGVTLNFYDMQGHIITPGEASPAKIISPDNLALNYRVYPVSTGHSPKPGNYNAAVHFKISYL